LDLRERVVCAVAGGASCRATAARFEVSISFVVKLMQRWRRQGSAAADRYGGWKRSPLEAAAEQVLVLVAAVPHGDGKSSTLVAALRHDGLTPPCVFDGAINGARLFGLGRAGPGADPSAR
jgi:transposase